MTLTKTPLRLILAAALLSTAASARALDPVSYSYNFFQIGYADGATITGSFSGTDVDGDGLLLHYPFSASYPPSVATHELTSWSAHFSGNSLMAAFDLTLLNLHAFSYEIGSPTLGNGLAHQPLLNLDLLEGIQVFGGNFYTSGRGPNYGFTGGHVGTDLTAGMPINPATKALDSTTSLVQVTPVPEPTSLALSLVGAISCLSITRRLGVLRAIPPFATSEWNMLPCKGALGFVDSIISRILDKLC